MINWLKRNWLLTVLLAIILVLLGQNKTGSQPTTMMPFSGGGIARTEVASSKMMIGNRDIAPPSDSASRIVIKDTSLSLQVKDVAAQIKTIESTAKSLGGFLVDSYLSKPESAANGTITIRVPEDKRSEALEAFKKLAVKVVSESVSGTDVTDQYVDLQARLDVLTKTKLKYEEILDRATRVEDLLNVQQQLTSLQQQIDSVKGQQKYYEQSAKLSKVTIYLSTDELALPYTPTNEWRPAVVFKDAVRSLVGSFRGLVNLVIWAIVYSPIIIPVVGLIWFYKKRSR